MYQQSSGSLSELTFEADESGAVATSISNSGIIGGQEVPPKGMPLPGYWTTTGGAALLTIDYDAWTQATGANNTGVIVGWWGASGSPGSGAVAWNGPDYAVETDLPHLPCDECDRLPVQVNAVNDAGVIVGMSLYVPCGNAIPCTTSPPGYDGNEAVEWNLATVIASCYPLTSACQAAVTDLNPAGTSDSMANDINNATPPLIVGVAGNHAALWSAPGKLTDLGTLPADSESAANAVNDAGEIVGESQSASGSSRAFVYVNGQMYDLNSLIDPTTSIPASTTLSNAVSINSNGWIAVNATVTTTGPYGDNGTTTTETVNAPNAYLLIPSH